MRTVKTATALTRQPSHPMQSPAFWIILVLSSLLLIPADLGVILSIMMPLAFVITYMGIPMVVDDPYWQRRCRLAAAVLYPAAIILVLIFG